jgi:diaminohydroxyphosphoribosylaminopyrimidine deaminase/5-amino-6-(5-phosphoribosylamino)uracil reductase
MSATSFMQIALRLARRGYGLTSPNPMVGAVLVKSGKVIGRGWHHLAGNPHAEIEALFDAENRCHSPRGATLFVTLEPCSTHGRTPPCTEAIIAAGIKRVVVGATDPNPKHAGKGFKILRRAKIEVVHGIAAQECTRLNEAFNHWIVHRTPFITVKAAMTLDGKIATAGGESKWITGESARAAGMKRRQGNDAILVGVNTVLADDPSLTVRTSKQAGAKVVKPIRRIILDSMARTPLSAKVASDAQASLTTIVVSPRAPKNRVAALKKKTNVLVAPASKPAASQWPVINVRWLLKKLGAENVTSVLVEGGGEVNASFLLGGLAQRVAFFYAPKILGGRAARRSVAGSGAKNLRELVELYQVEWQKIGDDLMLTALVQSSDKPRRRQVA